MLWNNPLDDLHVPPAVLVRAYVTLSDYVSVDDDLSTSEALIDEAIIV